MNLFKPENAQTAVVKIKKSKFISYLRGCDYTTEFKSWLSRVRRDHYDASHFCWGYAIDKNHKLEYHSSDAGEPTGTAGKPILQSIKKNKLVQSGLIVVRYFGGKKLGKRGLINAYSSAADKVIEKTLLVKRVNKKQYHINCPIKYYGHIYHILAKIDVEIIENPSISHPQWIIEVKENRANELRKLIQEKTKGEAEMQKINTNSMEN